MVTLLADPVMSLVQGKRCRRAAILEGHRAG